MDGGDGWLLLPPSLLSHKPFWRNCFSVWAVLFWMMRDEHKHMYCIFSFENLKCHYLPQVVYFLLCAPRKPNLWIEFYVYAFAWIPLALYVQDLNRVDCLWLIDYPTSLQLQICLFPSSNQKLILLVGQKDADSCY